MSLEVFYIDIAGALFLLLVIVQHLGGLTAYLGNKSNPQHRSFGKILVNIGRIVAAVGWILAGNTYNAIVVGVASLVILVFALALGSDPKPKSSNV